MPKMLEKPEWLRATVLGKAIGVDREKNVIGGVILAEEGPFKSEGRGEFDRKAIRSIVKMGNEKTGGLKSRFSHPTASDDGLGKHLGRMKNLRSDTVMREAGTDESGKPLMKEMLIVRGDLHLDQTALEEPPGGGKPLGQYVMDLAESDPDAFGTSLVLQKNDEYRLDKQGKPLRDPEGNDLPPLWIPTKLHASDVVAEGDATKAFLSADILASLPDAIVRQGCELLDAQFPGQERSVIKARLSAFVDRYLNHRFGDQLDIGGTTTGESEEEDDECGLEVGDRVMVNGTPRKEGQSVGTVALVKPYAYGIIFDELKEDGVFKWYVGEELLELESVDDGGDEGMSAGGAATKDWRLAELELMELEAG